MNYDHERIKVTVFIDAKEDMLEIHGKAQLKKGEELLEFGAPACVQFPALEKDESIVCQFRGSSTYLLYWDQSRWRWASSAFLCRYCLQPHYCYWLRHSTSALRPNCTIGCSTTLDWEHTSAISANIALSRYVLRLCQ